MNCLWFSKWIILTVCLNKCSYKSWFSIMPKQLLLLIWWNFHQKSKYSIFYILFFLFSFYGSYIFSSTNLEGDPILQSTFLCYQKKICDTRSSVVRSLTNHNEGIIKLSFFQLEKGVPKTKGNWSFHQKVGGGNCRLLYIL